MTQRDFEKGIGEIIGVFTDPIIVFPGGWGDSLPDWIKAAITLDRLIMNVEALKTGKMTGTDAEAVAYLYCLSLTQPIDSDWTNIYIYLTGKVMLRHKKTEIPPDIRVEKLTNDQVRELNRFKDWLYETRVKVRMERDRAERWKGREEKAVQKELEQPALFKF